MSTYYDKKYFDWQKKSGVYGATQDIRLYLTFIKQSDAVLDFGCGGGYLLEKIPAKVKYGVDINQQALKEAEKRGIKTYDDISSVPKQLKVDVIISHHTLEHVENPADVLRKLKDHLKPNGVFVGVVPIDDWRNQKHFTKKDINKHLFTWTPLLLGNLFIACGYSLKEVKIITSAWLPLSRIYYPYVPKVLYYFLCHLWSMFIRSRQIRVVARQVK